MAGKQRHIILEPRKAGKCLKAQVRATLVALDGRWFIGTNGVTVPQEACPRAGSPSFTWYEACTEICRQESHAEVSAINLAGEAARGATIYLEGHFAPCPDCQAAADAAGIAEIIVGAPPVQQ